MAENTPQEAYNIALNRIDDAAKKGLTALDLSGLGLYALPPEIGQIKKLRSLNLGQTSRWEVGDYNFSLGGREHHWIAEENYLSDLPSEIEQLTDLTSLTLTGNKFANLPDVIGKLTNLTTLDLAGNSLTILSPVIGKLKNLTSLMLDNNQLIDLPPEMGELTALTTLSLGRAAGRLTDYDDPKQEFRIYHYDNLISQLPVEIGNCTNLKKLDLSGNKLTDLPAAIGKLTNLSSLDLSGNHLSALPIEITSLKKLKYLDLNENPLSIPPEILEKTSKPSAIWSAYFGYSTSKATQQEMLDKELLELASEFRQPLREAKLLFVGQGSVGKTSLVRRVIQGNFELSETKTEGISISHWQVLIQLEDAMHPNNKINLNIWDFGGQEIMHATHQFFFTKRSLYLLVLDSRLTQEENRIEYWLKIIQSFGEGSPVLVIGNKVDQHPLDIDRTGLQRKYPNIVDFLETSASTGAGIEELKTSITKWINNLPHIHDMLPTTWFMIKRELEKLGNEVNFVNYDKYLDLCIQKKISDETSQRTLIGFLHDLGVVLHFQDDPRLEALGILNPQWVTKGVYKILNSHTLFQSKGVLTTSMLDEILNLPEYPRGKRLFIVDMMKKFELCYDIPYGYNVEADKTFLVPDLLPKDEPTELKFNGVPALEYAYPVLPSSVITRFIVRMNQKIQDGLVWRTGVLLKIGENTALVKADIEDRKITIAIDGLEHTRRDALSAIRYQLDEIHGSIKGLNPQKRIPVPNAPNAEPLEYDYLLMLEREGQEFHLAKDGTRLVKVNVREVLSAVESEAQRKETGGNVTNIYIGGNVEGSNIVSGNNNVITQRIQDSFNKAEAADIQVELKNTLKQLADAVAVMAKSMPDEQATEVTDDLSKLVEEATKPKPNKKWYSVSIDGLIKAAENVEKVGEPVINLSRRVLSLLTGGAIK